jgi:hypothetical protein
MLLTLLSFQGTPPPPPPPTPDESDVIIGTTRERRVRKIDEEDLETLEIFATTLLIYHRNGQL